MINRQSQIFFAGLLILICAAVLVTFHDTMILKRFDIFVSEDQIPDYTDLFSEINTLIRSYVQ